jgi:hypothetical protein
MKLFKSVGKFIYPLGSTVLNHYMALQDSSMEKALNYSLLTALYTARTEGIKELLCTIEIQKWRHCLLTKEFIEIVNACRFDRPTFHDSGSLYGLIYEELELGCGATLEYQYLMYSSIPDEENEILKFYSRSRQSFELKNGELSAVEFSVHDVLFINSVLGYRENHELPPRLSDIKLGSAQGAVLALRASEGEVDFTRTTIHGTDVVVPCIDGIKSWMIETKREWYWRWLPHHDVGYFIPEPDTPDVGVVLAYQSNGAGRLTGFTSLIKEGV